MYDKDLQLNYFFGIAIALYGAMIVKPGRKGFFKMRCRCLIVGFVVLACSSLVGSATGEVDFEITADYFGKYIWRGQNINDKGVFQPLVSLGNYGFTGSIWGSQDWTSVNNNGGNFTELEYTLDYTHAIPGIDGLSGSAGAIHYMFPHTESPATTEVYVGLSLTNVPFTPSIKIYRDVDEFMGSYYQFDIGKMFEKVAVWSKKCYCGLALGASVGYGNGAYNKGYFSTVKDDGLNDLTLTAGLPICFGNWTVKPNINYSTMLSDSVRSATNKSDNLWAGVNISRSF